MCKRDRPFEAIVGHGVPGRGNRPVTGREGREDTGLPRLRIHDCRHTFASQGVMNGVGLTTVGKLLGHNRRETTAIYAHLDDAALQEAAAQAAAVIARAMGYRAASPPPSADHRAPQVGQPEIPAIQPDCATDWTSI